jgi:ATP-dependent RNA helicase DDX10/DBP4
MLAPLSSVAYGCAWACPGRALAFVSNIVRVQLLETLFRNRWTQLDGVGAIIISPTRELAVQIFEELRKVGENHSFSAGLLIGGKSVAEERQHILSVFLLMLPLYPTTSRCCKASINQLR